MRSEATIVKSPQGDDIAIPKVNIPSSPLPEATEQQQSGKLDTLTPRMGTAVMALTEMTR